MVSVDNLASKLQSLISTEDSEDISDWRLIGQEQNGLFLLSWVQTSKNHANPHTHIGIYDLEKNILETIYKFNEKTTCIQASITLKKNVLGFVTKENPNPPFVYKAFLYYVGKDYADIHDLKVDNEKQIMLQFLYPKQSILSEVHTVKFILFVHQEGILQYQIPNENLEIKNDAITKEYLVKRFLWAQWDPLQQTLYYIHNRKRSKCLVEGEDEHLDENTNKLTPTLTGLQFNDELPQETVMNIPLNLPNLTSATSSCMIYEDDAIPLRIHDCSLDLIVLTDPSGIVCICHYYLYQPIHPVVELEDDDTTTVHLAYSVTILHQSVVIHCVVPEIPWHKARRIKPVFKIIGHYLVIFIPEVCTQLLDIGLMHEPCCHITTKPLITDVELDLLCLTPVISSQKSLVVNLATLDLIDLSVPSSLLIETFKNDTLLENKLSILHYFILHADDIENASELISWHSERPFTLGYPQLLKEYLIGTTYSSVQRNWPSDANKFLNLLPITTQKIGFEMEVEVSNYMICLSQDVLWNASMMLLSPQQRIVPFRSDIWVKLWEQLAKLTKETQRFKSTQVVEKLMVSLVCYQPEVLSRCSTPLSPSGGSATTLNDFLNSGKRNTDSLPFFEVDNCTASKQEHIISVNLRELSMHLLKQSTDNKITRFQWQTQTPMHVHAVATRYITAQLDQSRQLCQLLCKAATYDPRYDLEKGFLFIGNLSEERRFVFFTILEKYYLAVESIAFPLPQGFTSFFTFLGYKTLRFDTFLQYVNRNVFELQIDVMKIIMADTDNSSNGIDRKLQLLTALPRSRAKRLLNQWNHPLSLMLRAREHSLNILSGVVATPSGRRQGMSRKKSYHGTTAFPSGENFSPLDTFLDLLTAKAALTDIDFGLLIEATETSTDALL